MVPVECGCGGVGGGVFVACILDRWRFAKKTVWLLSLARKNSPVGVMPVCTLDCFFVPLERGWVSQAFLARYVTLAIYARPSLQDHAVW